MNKQVPSLRIFADQFVYSCRLLITSKLGVLSAALVPVLVILAFHYVGGAENENNLQNVAGALTMGIIMIAFATHATGLVAARDQGILKRLHGSPLPEWCYFAGRTAAISLLTMLGAGIAIVIANFVYTITITFAITLPIFVTILLGAITWSTIGTAVVRLIRDSSTSQTILTAIWLPLILVSGVFFPLSGEPNWLQDIVKLFPVEPITESLARTLHNNHAYLSVSSLTILLAWTVLGVIVSLTTFKWERS